jgi:protease I
MEKQLKNLKVAIIVADGFEQVEMTEPRKALEEAGAKTTLISIKDGLVKGWNQTEWGNEFTVDKTIDQVKPDEFNALLLPGGVMNPDKLRADQNVLKFVKTFVESGKPVASICHGPWTLAEAGVLKGKKVTSYHSIKTDLINAGANWVDEPVVVDQGLVTSRKPDDIPQFNKKMLEEFAEVVHAVKH